MREPTEIRLGQPIEYLGIRYEFVRMRSPSSNEISFVRRKYHTKYLRGVHLTALMCGIPMGFFKKICTEDAERIGAAVNSYLEAL